jgi:hypothetical protein
MTRCAFCGADIMLVGELWYCARIADINGFCPKSPDDLHHPASEAKTQKPGPG